MQLAPQVVDFVDLDPARLQFAHAPGRADIKVPHGKEWDEPIRNRPLGLRVAARAHRPPIRARPPVEQDAILVGPIDDVGPGNLGGLDVPNRPLGVDRVGIGHRVRCHRVEPQVFEDVGCDLATRVRAEPANRAGVDDLQRHEFGFRVVGYAQRDVPECRTPCGKHVLAGLPVGVPPELRNRGSERGIGPDNGQSIRERGPVARLTIESAAHQVSTIEPDDPGRRVVRPSRVAIEAVRRFVAGAP